jgi:hypothetical protein
MSAHMTVGSMPGPSSSAALPALVSNLGRLTGRGSNDAILRPARRNSGERCPRPTAGSSTLDRNRPQQRGGDTTSVEGSVHNPAKTQQRAGVIENP